MTHIDPIIATWISWLYTLTWSYFFICSSIVQINVNLNTQINNYGHNIMHVDTSFV